jgi:hypothetical protein
MQTERRFAKGDRVMVARYEGQWNLNGFYGHVTYVQPDNPWKPPMCSVALQGCTDPGRTDAEHWTVRKQMPYPFYESELDHAD